MFNCNFLNSRKLVALNNKFTSYEIKQWKILFNTMNLEIHRISLYSQNIL